MFRAGADVVSVDASVLRDEKPVVGPQDRPTSSSSTTASRRTSPMSPTRSCRSTSPCCSTSAPASPARARRAAAARCGSSAPTSGRSDRLRLITFNMRVRRLVDFASRRRTSIRRWRRCAAPAAAPSSTALAVALTAAAPPGRRQLVVLFSDGQDSSSISDADTLIDVARRTTPTVAVDPGIAVARAARLPPSHGVAARIGQRRHALGAAGGRDRRLRRRSWSRGRTSRPKFRRVLDQFRSSYVLYFTPRGVDARGRAYARSPRETAGRGRARAARVRLAIAPRAFHRVHERAARDEPFMRTTRLSIVLLPVLAGRRPCSPGPESATGSAPAAPRARPTPPTRDPSTPGYVDRQGAARRRAPAGGRRGELHRRSDA